MAIGRPKKLVFGVGINDSDSYVGKSVTTGMPSCPIYNVWISMLRRCYSEKFQEKVPSYIGCTVDGKWHRFSEFRKWMLGQEWQGKQLDKDILISGNKLYSDETCLFVSSAINNLFLDKARFRGDLPIGVTRSLGKYTSRCNNNGRSVYLGTFDTPELANSAYLAYKSQVIVSAAITQQDNKVFMALIKRAADMSKPDNYGK